MENIIQQHRSFVFSQIQKSITNDFEKAVAVIGEIRHWQDGDYRKVDNGKWVKVENGKEKKVGNARIQRVLRDEYDRLQSQFNQAMSEFESRLETKYSKGTLAYRVFFSNAWQNEVQENKFIQRIKAEQSDINDEIREIKNQILESKKKKREAESGKKEIDVNDLNDLINTHQRGILKISSSVKKYASAKQVMPEVTTDDYFLDTETNFKNLFNEKREDLDDVWERMKKNDELTFHKSPKSYSEYLINKTTGEVYRYSNHWGKVASCDWYLNKPLGTLGWDIAKSYVSKFKRKDTGLYFNPNYREAVVDFEKQYLSKIKKLVSKNQSFYLTDKAQKRVNGLLDFIYRRLEYDALLSIKEIERLKKQYELI